MKSANIKTEEHHETSHRPHHKSKLVLYVKSSSEQVDLDEWFESSQVVLGVGNSRVWGKIWRRLCHPRGRVKVFTLGTETVGGKVAAEQVFDVWMGLAMEGFVGQKVDFELDALWDREPVEVLEDDIVIFEFFFPFGGQGWFTGAGVGEEAGSRVLDMLKFIGNFWRWTIENAVAVVNSGYDECMGDDFSSPEEEWVAEVGDIFEVKEGNPGDQVDALF